jgi:hypothetical protein
MKHLHETWVKKTQRKHVQKTLSDKKSYKHKKNSINIFKFFPSPFLQKYFIIFREGPLPLPVKNARLEYEIYFTKRGNF